MGSLSLLPRIFSSYPEKRRGLQNNLEKAKIVFVTQEEQKR